jgi:hypothetical protein
MRLPWDDGAEKLTTAFPSPAFTVGLLGFPGTASKVTWLDALDTALEPTEFFAFTVNVYSVL